MNRRRRAVNGSRILLLGLAYKANTGDDRESPAVVVAERLLTLGAEVRAADPYVGADHVHGSVERVEVTPAELAAADAVVLLTDHDAFDMGMVGKHARYVLDTRRRVPAAEHVEYL